MVHSESPNSPEGLGRGNMTTAKRLDLLERDRGQQSEVLTGLIESIEKGFNQAQMEQLRGLLREELANVGLRIDEPEDVDGAREDFRYLRRLRISMNGIASKIGMAVIVAILGAVAAIFTLGLTAWKGLA